LITTVQPDASALADCPEVERESFCCDGRSVELQRVERGAGEALGIGVAELSPGRERLRSDRRRQFRSAIDEFHIPGSGQSDWRICRFQVEPRRAFDLSFREDVQNARFSWCELKEHVS
jgi:hypothetical protein